MVAATDVQTKDGVSNPAGATQTPTNQSTQTPTPPGFIPKTDLDNLRSILDKQVATIRNENKALKDDLAAEKLAREELKEAQDLANMGDLSPEQLADKKSILLERRNLRKKQEDLVDLEKRVADKAKEVYAKELSTQYKVPLEVLMTYDTPEKMELVALKSENELLRTNKPGTPRGPGFDSGASGTSGSGDSLENHSPTDRLRERDKRIREGKK